jgi:hypothetical protein
MSVQTTTYIHVHVGDEVTVKPGSPVDESGTIVRLGDLADVALFLDRASALQLAQDILARYAAPVLDSFECDGDCMVNAYDDCPH